jgi:hypothetical protein
MFKKRGLSTVVATLLLILLALALVGIVWAVVTNLIEEEVEKTSCLDTIGEVGFTHQYVCYNASNGSELRFAISIGEVNIDAAVISVSAGGTTKGFKILAENSTVNHVTPYNRAYSEVALPGQNGGLSYLYNMSSAGFTGRPDSIQISPQIADNVCDAVDMITEIVNCYALA